MCENDDIKEVFAEAKGTGFDTKAIRTIIRLRKKDQAEREEEESILDLYKAALGMVRYRPRGRRAPNRARNQASRIVEPARLPGSPCGRAKNLSPFFCRASEHSEPGLRFSIRCVGPQRPGRRSIGVAGPDPRAWRHCPQPRNLAPPAAGNAWLMRP